MVSQGLPEKGLAFDDFLQETPFKLSNDDKGAIERSYHVLQALIASNQTIYGVNTGFGKLATTTISEQELHTLQHKIIESHMAGVGACFEDNVVAKILLLKINSLRMGYSGVRLELVEALLKLYNEQFWPQIPCKGSVGASGDLAPLAHLSGVLLGHGFCKHQGKLVPAQEVLDKLAINVLPLHPKEGLALLNGTQVSTALALEAYLQCFKLFDAALLTGSLSLEAACGSDKPFDDRIHRIRSKEQQQVASVFREILQSSEIRASHIDCSRVQDPYSLRCQPQVMGAVLGSLHYAGDTLGQEINAVTDNPLILPEDAQVISGGNFHAQSIAFCADAMANAIAEIGSLSERRIALLMDSALSGLPQFLIENPGINSGFMIAQVTAAALVHENKALSTPSSVDSIPTSANQEDHVSMATYAARRLHTMVENCSHILAIELLVASQGVDFRKPLQTSKPLQALMDSVRSKAAFYQQDRVVATDIESLSLALLKGDFKLSQFGISSIQYWK